MKAYITGNFGYRKYREAGSVISQFVLDEVAEVVTGSQLNYSIADKYAENSPHKFTRYSTEEEAIKSLDPSVDIAVIFWDGHEKEIRRIIETCQSTGIQTFPIVCEWGQLDQGYDGSWHFGYRYYLITPLDYDRTDEVG